MSVRLLSIVPGKPMYTSTKEFRPQSQKSCYQKTFWGWHTQYTQSRSPFSGPMDPQIACYLAATPLSDAMVFYAMGIFKFCSRKAEGSLHRAEWAGAPIQDLGFGTWLENSLQWQNLGLLDKIGTFLGPFWDLSGTFCRYFDDTTAKQYRRLKRHIVATFSAKSGLFENHFRTFRWIIYLQFSHLLK